jgi:phycocyanobilin lyase alpha subunit
MTQEMAESWTLEQALANLQQTEDPSARYYAAWWLGRFRVGGDAALNGLRDALQDESDRSPDGGYPVRRNAARALGKLNRPEAVPDLIACLACEDFYVREAAARSLGQLGQAAAIAPLVDLLAGGVAAAVPVPGKPHLTQPYEAILEALGCLGAVDHCDAIEPFLKHDRPKIACAAARALYQLTGQATYGDFLVQMLRQDNLQLRRSALMDLGAMGYLPGAIAVKETLAENSLKLIALKGILEQHLPPPGEAFRPEVVQVMDWMDQLL